MSQQQIELSYDRRGIPWYRKRWVQRWTTGIAILIAAAWAANAARPVWVRYRYYRLQQRAATFTTGPTRVLVHTSATQPYVHLTGPTDQFLNSYWTAASEAGLGQFLLQNAAASTPVFCGLGTTAAGHEQIVQIYAYVGSVGGQPGLWAFVATSDLRGWQWVLTGRSGLRKSPIGAGIFVGYVNARTNPSDEVLVSSGSANALDPSEVDLPLILNRQPGTIPFHVFDVTKPPAYVAIGMDRTVFFRIFNKVPDWSSGGIWDWPLPAK